MKAVLLGFRFHVKLLTKQETKQLSYKTRQLEYAVDLPAWIHVYQFFNCPFFDRVCKGSFYDVAAVLLLVMAAASCRLFMSQYTWLMYYLLNWSLYICTLAPYPTSLSALSILCTQFTKWKRKGEAVLPKLLNGFRWNLVSSVYAKICPRNLILVSISPQ